MDYLAILKNLDAGKAVTSNMRVSVAERSGEKSEISEKSPVQLAGCAECGPEHAEFPTRRCYVCNGWLFWLSVHGAVICAGCHSPANPNLVRRWYWLPEGECKRTQ